MSPTPTPTAGLLFSGGLDSSILLGHLLDAGYAVQPFYVQSGLYWEPAERQAAERYLAALPAAKLRPLVTLDQSVGGLYGDHWGMTGRSVPDATTPDAAVYLPGRNLLLISQAALWCQLQGIAELAIAVLGSNPFPDATDEFFAALERTLELATGTPLRVLRPFERLHKRDVMQLGRNYPLELSFSCIDPRGSLHCGACNKCAERQAAFAAADMADPTQYHYDRLLKSALPAEP